MVFSFIKPPSVIEWVFVLFLFAEPPSVIEWVFVILELCVKPPSILSGGMFFVCAVVTRELIVLVRDDFGHQHIFLYTRLQAASLKTF